MRKIISLFARNYDGDRLVRDQVLPGAEWVINGEGVATRMFDGTCCRVLDGNLWKRYDAKHGKTPPTGFEPAQEADPVTGHWPGWVLVGEGSEDRWHREAYTHRLPDGTYELCGPKIAGNPERYDHHVLIRHGSEILHHCPRTFYALREYFAQQYLNRNYIEGVVWHHEDGRFVKIKAKDFGVRRSLLNI